MRARDRVVHAVQPAALALLRASVFAAGAARAATRGSSEVPAGLASAAIARAAPAAVSRATQERDASVGSDCPEGGEGDRDESAERVRDVLCTVRKERCRRRELNERSERSARRGRDRHVGSAVREPAAGIAGGPVAAAGLGRADGDPEPGAGGDGDRDRARSAGRRLQARAGRHGPRRRHDLGAPDRGRRARARRSPWSPRTPATAGCAIWRRRGSCGRYAASTS